MPGPPWPGRMGSSMTVVQESSPSIQRTDSPAAEQLIDFNKRLTKLESAGDHSSLARWQKIGAFASLMIGIVLSSYSLYDTFISKPDQAKLHNMEEFNKAVNTVANLRQSAINYMADKRNPELAMAMTSTITPQILANIQLASNLRLKLDKDIPIVPQLIVLISEAINIYDWSTAEKLVEQAVKSGEKVPTLRSEAFRHQARLFFMTGRIKEGREAFGNSMKSIDAEKGFGIDGFRANIAADWYLFEISLGDCSIASDRAKQFFEYANKTSQAYRVLLISSFKEQIAKTMTQNQRCPLPDNL